MQPFDYNQPNTRERIDARRRAQRRTSGGTPGPALQANAWMSSGRPLSLALVVVALVMLVYVSQADRFQVRDVQITGSEWVSTRQIEQLSDARGQSIWSLNTELIAERLRSNPYIERASARVALPDRLEIVVVERRPEVRWQHAGVRYLVDPDGLVLGLDTTGTLSNTLVINDVSTERNIEPNDRLDADLLRYAQTLALKLQRDLGLSAQQLNWDTERGLFLVTPEQQMIIFGRDERLEEKLAVLRVLRQEQTPFTMLDLRPATPFYRTNDSSPTPQSTSQP
jgi:cell division protein FtsQ